MNHQRSRIQTGGTQSQRNSLLCFLLILENSGSRAGAARLLQASACATGSESPCLSSSLQQTRDSVVSNIAHSCRPIVGLKKTGIGIGIVRTAPQKLWRNGNTCISRENLTHCHQSEHCAHCNALCVVPWIQGRLTPNRAPGGMKRAVQPSPQSKLRGTYAQELNALQHEFASAESRVMSPKESTVHSQKHFEECVC